MAVLLGLALGDALGAPHEGGLLERALWRLIGRTRRGERRWTDDTRMALGLAESLLACGDLDPDELARRWAADYHWSRGYGQGAAKVLRLIRRGMPWQQASRAVYPQGSWGNGAAMRAPVLAMYAHRQPQRLRDLSAASARVTHAHPLAVEGAILIAVVTAQALTGDGADLLPAAIEQDVSPPFRVRLQRAGEWLRAGASPPPPQVASELGNGISAEASVVTAIYLAARFVHRPFSEMVDFAIAMGGDVDTISAMAGAIWGGCNGRAALPQEHLAEVEQRQRIETIAEALYAHALQNPSGIRSVPPAD